MQKQQNGFTLIEIMIAVMIIGILAAVAVPQYGNYLTRAKRSDGHVALRAASQEMERCRTQNFSYATCTPNTTVSSDGHYTIEISADVTRTSTVYELTAKAKTGGAQANDTDCTEMTIDALGATKPDACW